ncbi:MAG: hypothetical protein AUJ12_03330 [Alphaproteobacteria bacterium CG1_02_46_17]|nr:MAG: hypothetical protein AUJ12_03330 [Alphaproteobacteria bacterium CG1_02_46_17]
MKDWYSILVELTRGFIKKLITDLADFFAHQEETRLLWPPIFIALGAALYFGLSFEPTNFAVSATVAGSVGFFLYAKKIYHQASVDTSEIKYLFYLFMGVILLTQFGFSLSQLGTYMVGTPMIKTETRVLKVEGDLLHFEDRGGNKGKLLLIDHLKINGFDEEETPKSLRLIARTKIEEEVAVGDRISFLAKLTPPASPVMPGAYDYARHFFFEGIGGMGFIVSKISLVEKQPPSLWPDLDIARQSVSQKIKSKVEGPTQGIVVALMTGERAAVEEDDWQALRASGLAHIISISGLHVAMVAAPIFFIVRLFLSFIPMMALRFDIKKISAFIALLGCSAYVGFVVPSVPTTRALLMTGVALIAIMLDRSPFSLRLVGFSALLVLFFSPESIWSASFQMSFAAVTALVAVAGWMRPVWLRINREAGWFKKIMIYLAGAVITSFVASIATTPFVWYHFQQMATYSVLGNMLAMPLSGLIIMPMLILSYVLIPFGWEGPALHLMAMGVEWLLQVARFVESLPGALVTGKMVDEAFLYFITGSCLIVLLFRGRWKWVSLPVAFIAIWMAAQTKYPDILVSNEGNLILVREGNIGYVSSLRREKFIRDQWQKHLGLDEIKAFPAEGEISLANGDYIRCDKSQCRIGMNGAKISFGDSYNAMAEDCPWADFLITTKWVKRSYCENAKVMGAGFFREEGSTEISHTRYLTSRTVRGNRPWAK